MLPQRTLLIIAIYLFTAPAVYGLSPTFDFENAETDLLTLFEEVLDNPSQESNLQFTNAFKRVLMQEGAFGYPFDSLENVGKLRSENGKIRIITWNLPLNIGVNQHHGFVMVKHNGEVNVYQLNDSRNGVEEAFTEVLPHSKWYGALYYHLHQEEYQGVYYYTLLGVSLMDLFTTQRIIEPLWIDHEGKPVFGSPIFNVRGRRISRVVLAYSARVNVMLRYSPEMEMLVFDHLVPSRPQYQGVYSHYGPDLSHDGFRFEGGQWFFEQNIDLRNPETRDRPTPIEDPEPGFIYRRNN